MEAVATHSHLLHFVCLYSECCGRGFSFVSFCLFVQWMLWPRTLIYCIMCVCTVEAVAADSYLLHFVCLYSGGRGQALSFLAFCHFFIIICCILCVCTAEAVAADSHYLHSVYFYSGGCGRELSSVVFSVFVQLRQWPRTLICCILCVCAVEAVAANSQLLHSVCLYSGGCGRGLPFIAFCVFVQWMKWPRTLICCILCVCTVEAVATHSHLLHFVCLYSEGCGHGLSFVAFCVFVQWRQWPRTLISSTLSVCTVKAVATDSHLLHFVCLYSEGCGRGLSFIAFCVFVQWRLWPQTLICCILCVCTVKAVATDSHLLHSVCLYNGGSGRRLSFVAFCVFVQWRLWPQTLFSCIICVCTVEAVAADSHLLYSLCLYSGGCGRGLSLVVFSVLVQWRQWPRTPIYCILCVCTVEAVAADSHLLHFVCLYSEGCGRGLSFIAFCVFVQWRLRSRTLIYCILCVCTVKTVTADSHLLHSVCLYSGGSGRGLSFVAFCVFVQ